MDSPAPGQVEARTLELGQRLFDLTRGYHPTTEERVQDWLMGQMAQCPTLKARLLRFMDTLAALDFDHRGAYAKKLFREYFDSPFPRSSLLLRSVLFLGRQKIVPAGVVSGLSRRAVLAIADRFIAGTGVPDMFAILAYLERQGRYPTFDLLGEEVFSEDEAHRFKTRYLDLIDHLAGHPRAGNRTPGGTPALQLSIKLSSLTDNFNYADPEGTLRRVRGRIEEIVRRCVSGNIGLNIDAEQYEYRELAWHIFSQVFGPQSEFGRWDGIGISVQSYFRDSEEYLWDVVEFAVKRNTPFQVRLTKGAYWDYEIINARQNHWPAPVYENKWETDQAFQRMLSVLLQHSREVMLAVASHNLRDHAYAEALRDSLGLAPGAVEHQTLFRTAEGVSRALRRMGWESRDYVPSGELVPGMAYLVRRILENTSPAGYLMRSRKGEKAGLLLQPPGAGAQEDPGLSKNADIIPAPFSNNPAKRLFLPAERVAFESALKTIQTRWGKEYLLDLGGRPTRTVEIKPSLSPSTPDPTHPVGLVHMAGIQETQQAIDTVRRGLVRWSAMGAKGRAGVLARAGDLLAKERDNLAAWITHEGGRTWAEALADVDEAVDHFAYNANLLLACQPILEERYSPRGVVAVISPWNFPAALPAGMMSGALAAGNTVILKSAEQTPVIACQMVEILHAAGVPEDALIHLPGWGETAGNYLVESPDVDMVAFTGSRTVGLTIFRKASSTRLTGTGIKRSITEMGGKNAIIVFPDADMDEAVRGILLSAFEHANQKCSACSRVFVHRSIYGRLRERLVSAVASLPVGPADDPGTKVNPLIEPEAKERVLAYAKQAASEGKVLVDRTRIPGSGPLQVGPMIVELEPAIVAESAIAQEEIFGPVLAMVSFEDEARMLEQVNGTAYALTAGVFSRSPATIARMVRAVRAGNIYVNRKITGARVGIEPFGGFQLSGTGPKTGSREYLFAFVKRRAGYDPARASAARDSDAASWRLAGEVGPWQVGVARRCEVLRRGIRLMEEAFRKELVRALERRYQTSPPDTEKIARQMLDTLLNIVESTPEVAEPEATMDLPGQRNYITWETPRGRGFVATDDATPCSRFAGMVFGPLLAGNGLILAPAATSLPVAVILLKCLHRAGVPRTALGLAPHGGPEAAAALADDMFHFAVTDLGAEQTQRVYRQLGETREDQGQRWVKALISMQEGPQPGEPGFLRLFALPRTIAIRTLRHGADMEMPAFGGRISKELRKP